jgi:hypothetical protein
MLRVALALIALAVSAGAPASAQTGPNAFSFVAFGDMPYRPEDDVKVDRLIGAINRLKPACTIHFGDIKSGFTPCDDDAYRRALAQINTLEQPVVYSIGDNEWADCQRHSSSKADPRERLVRLRELAFPKPGESLGRAPMPVESQSKLMPKYTKFVENQRFTRNGVVFIIPHVVGSNNGFDPKDPPAAAEFRERNAANVAWIEDGFRLAMETKAKAVVIAFQANPYETSRGPRPMPSSDGFVDTVQAIVGGARAFGRPVLVVHGDNHVLELESFKDVNMQAVPNTLRLQLFGDPLIHAMRILVDPDMPGVFGFIPLIVPENGPF